MIVCTVNTRMEIHHRLNDLDGLCLVQVQREDGSILAAADLLGAKPGDHVAVCQGEAAQCVLGRRCPIDAAIIAVFSIPHR
ncbi:MAG: hypothetical protein MJ077_07135 [Oscillospiraceae bacterium]|nr:hypothetical protein [Oscillospiraceae bacterium]